MAQIRTSYKEQSVKTLWNLNARKLLWPVIPVFDYIFIFGNIFLMVIKTTTCVSECPLYISVLNLNITKHFVRNQSWTQL